MQVVLFIHQSLVVLPDAAKTVIFVLLSLGATLLLNQLALIVPWLASFLDQYKDVVVTTLAAAIIAWIEAQLNLLPQYEEVINAGLQFLAVVITVFVLPFLTFKWMQRKGVRAAQ